MTTPTPTRTPHPITMHLRDEQTNLVAGSCAVRLVLVDDRTASTPGAWAITHTLGSIANGTYTEVVFVDGEPEPTRVADSIVRQVANAVYPHAWAFHYLPERVADAVLAHGCALRERIEVSEVEVWEA